MPKRGRFRALTRWLKIGDKILVLCLLCASIVSGVIVKRVHQEAKYCIISVNGKDEYKLLLSQPQKVKVDGPLGGSIIEISDRGARMLDSPCPLKICMHQGVIRAPGEMIICIPNRIMVRIIGTQEVDAITW